MITEEDIISFVNVGNAEGIIEEDEKEMIHSIVTLGETNAKEVMTPRIKIKALDDSKTLDEAIAILTDYHFSRIPVYHDHIDTIDRVVMLKELLRLKKTKP